jgi:spermidine synthase
VTSWMHIDTGIVPGGTPLHLMRRGHEFSIVADTIELMNSTRGASEEALAILACGRVRGRGAARVLVGGLGMGFTLRAALFAGCLDDARVDLREADVDDLIQSGPAAWDAILLDVDNGPEGFVRPENDRLYGGPGLALARRALRPGGVLGVWSATPDRKFKARLQRSGFVVEEVRPHANGHSGPRHVVWIATSVGPTA